MNENLILEGNTIYELDPICMRTKRNLVRKQTVQGERITAVAGRENGDGCGGCRTACPRYAVFCACLLAGGRIKCQ